MLTRITRRLPVRRVQQRGKIYSRTSIYGVVSAIPIANGSTVILTTWAGCPPRSYEEHRQLALEWKSLEGKERSEHFKEHGSRWAEIMRLPYYDCIRMTVIDPMHNLLLGAFLSSHADAVCDVCAFSHRCRQDSMVFKMDQDRCPAARHKGRNCTGAQHDA